MSNLPLQMLRLVSLLEGLSLLFLLYASIYEKRILGDDEAIRVPGMIHGVLFLLFCLMLAYVWIDRKWSFGKVLFAFLCSLVPFAAFYLEGRLKAELAVD